VVTAATLSFIFSRNNFMFSQVLSREIVVHTETRKLAEHRGNRVCRRSDFGLQSTTSQKPGIIMFIRAHAYPPLTRGTAPGFPLVSVYAA
jgi:hypothetical protein